jgi:hypothetical protein
MRDGHVGHAGRTTAAVVAVVAMLLVAAGCASGTTSTIATGSVPPATSGPAPSAQGTSLPAPSATGATGVDAAGQLACGRGQDTFGVDALSGPTGADQADTPEAAALRDYLSRPSAMMPGASSSWRLAARSDTRALFLRGDPPNLSEVVVALRDGTWQFEQSGGCGLQRHVAGASYASWVLDGNQPAPTEASAILHLRVSPMECTSGEPAGARVRAPTVQETDDEVIITVLLDPLPPGSYTCIGIIGNETPVDVVLTHPLGDRRLLDGLPYPPAPVERWAAGTPSSGAIH